MERTPVSSETIRSVGYDTDSSILEIEFNNSGVYQYADVPESEFGSLMAADSKGKYFNRNIKTRYSCVKL